MINQAFFDGSTISVCWKNGGSNEQNAEFSSTANTSTKECVLFDEEEWDVTAVRMDAFNVIYIYCIYIYISIHCNRVDLAGSCILYSPRKQSSQDCRDSTYEDDSANFVGQIWQSNSILRQDTHHYVLRMVHRFSKSIFVLKCGATLLSHE